MTQALDPNATYISPSGRPCRWYPLGGKDRHYTDVATFVYLDRPRPRFGFPEGFSLRSENFGILRKGASDAARR